MPSDNFRSATNAIPPRVYTSGRSLDETGENADGTAALTIEELEKLFLSLA
jgi:hypothetical protein